MPLLATRTLTSGFNIDLDEFWRFNRTACAVAFLNYLSSRWVLSRPAFEFRERLLEWIPERLGEVKLGSLALAQAAKTYMNCTYAITAKKHAIKRPLMEQMRRACLQAGVVEHTASGLADRAPLDELDASRATSAAGLPLPLGERAGVRGSPMQSIIATPGPPHSNSLPPGEREPTESAPLPRVNPRTWRDEHGRATVVVIGEQFYEGHATFRCFAPAIKSLREHFNLIGVIYPDPAGTTITEFFDECVAVETGDFPANVRALAATILTRKPALILYLGVGMVIEVIALASLRLAPIQCASIGCNASTMSPMMDYFILPEDWIASRDCFLEKVLPLPKRAMAFLPPLPQNVKRQPSGPAIRVAICASTMKLNPALFEAIGRIADGAKTQAEFHFFPVGAIGLVYFELSRVVRAAIPRATVHPQLPYERYIERLARCDFFLSPFPHGGMTSIMDTFQLGMPGVCLDGPEPHAHADAAIFARIDLPTELTAKSVDQYVAAAIRLIDDEAWRQYCAELVHQANLGAAFFSGDAGLFCKAIAGLIDEQQARSGGVIPPRASGEGGDPGLEPGEPGGACCPFD